MDFSFDLGNEEMAADGTAFIPSPLWTTKQAAVYLGLSMSTLNKWRCYGSGPAFLKLGRSVRYRKSQLDNFLTERTASNTIY